VTVDPDLPHVLTPPIQAQFSGTWVGFCSCGKDFVKASAEEVREAGRPHRLAELERLSRTPSGVDRGSADMRK
jgi:hypothetical protein